MPIMLYCNWTVKPWITWMVENAVGLQAFQGQAIINQVPQPPSISMRSSHATGVWFSIDPVIMQMEIWNQYLVPTIMLRGGNIINYDAAYLCQWSSILGSVFYFLYRVPMTHCKDINILHHLLTNFGVSTNEYSILKELNLGKYPLAEKSCEHQIPNLSSSHL